MLVWTNKYSVGVRRIDADHVTLVALLNQLHINLADDKSDDALEPILSALLNYADYHFRFEERIMAQFGYPGRDAHVAAHDVFRHRIRDLLAEAPENRETGRRLRAVLGRWLFDHIAGVDADLGSWLAGRGLDAVAVEHPAFDGADRSGTDA